MLNQAKVASINQHYEIHDTLFNAHATDSQYTNVTSVNQIFSTPSDKAKPKCLVCAHQL